ncbi:uncharacterized protein K460DRAFT_251778, partial [Cucurbitaria berberidis CBS 394.84]
IQDGIAKLGAGTLFSAAPRWPWAARHTPCHDVIQGTCRIRRSGPLPGPSLLRRMTPQQSPSTISPFP